MAHEHEGLGTEEIASAGERDHRRDEPARDEGIVEAPVDEPVAEAERTEPLLPREELDGLRRRWEEIQTGFVDEPRRSVEEADGLVADLMQRLARSFSDERSRLESQWDRGDEVSTEDLRVALTRYRSFFNRLLEA